MSDVASRLETAFGEWGGSKSELSARLREAGVRGHTRNAINDYLAGDSRPSTEWVRATASILGVRPEWLAFGSRPKREDADPRYIKNPKHRKLRDELEWFGELPLDLQHNLMQLLSAYDSLMPRSGVQPGDGSAHPLGKPYVERAKDLGFLLLLPLKLWGYEYFKVSNVPREYWSQVVGAVHSAHRTFTELHPADQAYENMEEQEVRKRKPRKPLQRRTQPLVDVVRDCLYGE